MYIAEFFVLVEWLSLNKILNKFLKFPKSEPRDSYKLDTYTEPRDSYKLDTYTEPRDSYKLDTYKKSV